MSSTDCYPSKALIREIFSHLATGDSSSFYAHVSNSVGWTVMGTHSLSGHYSSKEAFLSSSLSTIANAIDGPMKLRVTSIIGGETEEWAVVEMEAVEGTKCKNGMIYDQKYSWSTRWKDGMIFEVRAYLDGGLLDRALAGNGLPVGSSVTF
jgi:uncharacterized protein